MTHRWISPPRSRARGLIGAALAGLALAAAAAPAASHSLAELEAELSSRERYVEIVNRPAPEFALEDADGTPVDLLPVQRALRAFASADDVSLLNFANGTAVISMRATGELDLDKLAMAIGMATSRECEVIPQDQGKLFLRLSAEEGNRNG